MAEWLRRLTRNQIPSGSAGSNPAGCVYFYTFAQDYFQERFKQIQLYYVPSKR